MGVELTVTPSQPGSVHAPPYSHEGQPREFQLVHPTGHNFGSIPVQDTRSRFGPISRTHDRQDKGSTTFGSLEKSFVPFFLLFVDSFLGVTISQVYVRIGLYFL